VDQTEEKAALEDHLQEWGILRQAAEEEVRKALTLGVEILERPVAAEVDTLAVEGLEIIHL